MGKRSKSSIASENLKLNKKAKNKKIKFGNNSDTEESEAKVPITPAVNKTTKNKTKLKKLGNKDNTEIRDVEVNDNVEHESKVEPTEPHTCPANKNVKSKKKNKAHPNINKPTDNNDTETSSDKQAEVKQTKKQRKIKGTNLLQEDDIKDEDIDKYCDEIRQEDNVQYENWVELLEAKLSNNKKKTK